MDVGGHSGSSQQTFCDDLFMYCKVWVSAERLARVPATTVRDLSSKNEEATIHPSPQLHRPHEMSKSSLKVQSHQH